MRLSVANFIWKMQTGPIDATHVAFRSWRNVSVLPNRAATKNRFCTCDALVKTTARTQIKNLEAAAKEKPQDTKVRLNLARAHGMAYASKAEKASAWKGKENEGVWFGYAPKHLPFPLVKGKDKKKKEEPDKHLPKAIELFRVRPDGREEPLRDAQPG